jgi:hypothetical protein
MCAHLISILASTDTAFRLRLESYLIKEYDGDWSITILGRLGTGQAVYARSVGPDIGSTAADLFRALSNRGSSYLWREDKFRK